MGGLSDALFGSRPRRAVSPLYCPAWASGASCAHEGHTLAGEGLPAREPIPTIERRWQLSERELGDLQDLVADLRLPFDDVFELRFSKAGPRVVLEVELQDSARLAAEARS